MFTAKLTVKTISFRPVALFVPFSDFMDRPRTIQIRDVQSDTKLRTPLFLNLAYVVICDSTEYIAASASRQSRLRRTMVATSSV
jgi:hypothetical protein